MIWAAMLVSIEDLTETVTELPDMRLGRYLWSLVVNHQSRRSQLFFHQQCPVALQQDICERLDRAMSLDQP
jgi:hypothetical protein